MRISKTIIKTRRHINRHLQTYMVSVIFFVLGLIVTVPHCESIARLFDIFSRQTANIICLVLLSTLIVLFGAYIFLKNDLKRHKKYLKQYAPQNFDIDRAEEYNEAWDEATREDQE